MKKVLSISLILVVLTAFVISCQDFGFSRIIDYSGEDLIEIGWTGIDLIEWSLDLYDPDSTVISKMITITGDPESPSKIEWKNFDFEKAAQEVEEEWDPGLMIIIKSGSATMNAQSKTKNFDLTYEIEWEGYEYPGTFHITGSLADSGLASLKVNGRKVDSFIYEP
ncbi:MAG: hypothetical protein GX842_02505 [Spirochaetales bacterium]|nr:hypothetical protein [Spirochaetales bacterium]